MVTFVASTQSGNGNVSYTNPIFPGWNSDPSCVFVAERDNTFFCTTSSFLAYPGAPIHPSKDLINWKLASNVINRPEQLPTLLTDNNKKPIAYYAETELQNANERKAMIAQLTEKYGKPKYAFFIASDFNQCSYEWVLADRTIQIETSFGFSTGVETNNGKYYKLDMLILDNKVKTALHQAHIFEFPEKIRYRGKEHSYKDFQFDKKSVFKDEFLLNSTYDHLIKNENNQYDISLASADE
ncbi:MAG: hypothetical protein EOO85_23060 [Pedobacter sp.]|nr:MAG: hypothetical protein EOO85_23060 [Pedobacter sp.]